MVKAWAERNRYAAWVGRLKRSVEIRDGRIADLRTQLQQAQEKLRPYAVGPSGEPFFKTKADAERALEQVEREYDEAIKRAEAAEGLLCKIQSHTTVSLPIILMIDTFHEAAEAPAQRGAP